MTEANRDIMRVDDGSLTDLMELGKRIQEDLGIEEPKTDLEAVIARWQAEQAHKKMKSYRFVILVEPDDGHFQARCPALDDCAGVGATPEEARTDLLTTLYSHLHDLVQQGRPIPTDESLAETVHVLLPAR